MKVLLSPAKSIELSLAPAKGIFSTSTFLKESEQLVNKLKKFSVKKLESTMHISKDLAILNKERFENWALPLVQNENSVPAGFVFNGEVYKGLDISSFSESELLIAQQNIRILSGLYGILKPLDLICPYRLEMGTKWEVTPKQKNLYQFWGSKLTKFLNAEMEKEEVIVNLASSEYFKAIDRKTLKSKVVTPVFKEFKNGEYKIVMMYAKHARGAMARYIVQTNITNVEELKLYTVDGYSYDVNQSTDEDWVFTR
ncbi:MAG: hypothetical protein RI922_2819 [Bacteroidota bacterium]|jgi:cytoplasmic iron level regulating protein YaaA (DUF328/UPF0246 family)